MVIGVDEHTHISWITNICFLWGRVLSRALERKKPLIVTSLLHPETTPQFIEVTQDTAADEKCD